NNKGDYNERKDLAPYAYDVLYLEYLDEETYAQVKKAAVHEKSGIIDVVYFLVLACYFVYFAFTIAATICNITLVFGELLLVCSSLWGCLAVFTGLMPILMIQYRKYKAL
ncbi:MAG: hypothetical protein K2N65_00565, partial [Anaeroplasmataceae bacterium]|nr:hypothetical protein [Anaeroplasmataceae bacterium]